MTHKKFQCDECGYYWENRGSESSPRSCPVCGSMRVHRSARHMRFAKKSRPQVRRSYSFMGGR